MVFIPLRSTPLLYHIRKVMTYINGCYGQWSQSLGCSLAYDSGKPGWKVGLGGRIRPAALSSLPQQCFAQSGLSLFVQENVIKEIIWKHTFPQSIEWILSWIAVFRIDILTSINMDTGQRELVILWISVKISGVSAVLFYMYDSFGRRATVYYIFF